MALKGKILIVDDDHSLKSSLIEWFESEHHQVFSASSGEEALELIAEKSSKYEDDLVARLKSSAEHHRSCPRLPAPALIAEASVGLTSSLSETGVQDQQFVQSLLNMIDCEDQMSGNQPGIPPYPEYIGSWPVIEHYLFGGDS